VHGGSGALLSAVESGKLDAAAVLTESLVAHWERNPQSAVRLLGPYTSSPLAWGVFCRVGRHVASLRDLDGGTFGVSRMGSGSHIMVSVMARQHGWTRAPTFIVCNDFATLRADTASGKVDGFLWEQGMTSPFVRAGQLSQVGTVLSPWPCFMLVARTAAVAARPAELTAAVAAIRNAALRFKADGAASVSLIATRYGIAEEAARQWFDIVQFAPRGVEADARDETKRMLSDTRRVLAECGAIAAPGATSPNWDAWIAELAA
jgi:sulfonate transport system substrate-binding protein